MAHTLRKPETRKHVIERIMKVRPDSPALWGKMNANQMLCHLADQIRLATGEITDKDESTFFGRNILVPLVLWGFPAPKGKVTTHRKLDHAKGAGTQPTEFEADRQILVDYIRLFETPRNDWHQHPMFGKLSHRQWARFAYTHMDHHLKQFGC